MGWKPEAWAIILPSPHDIDGQWIGVATFNTAADAKEFVMNVLGGDEKGRISTITPPPQEDEGWLVDLPNVSNPEEAWEFIESFDTKKEAVKFVKEKFGGDSQGRFKVIDVMYVSTDDEDEKGPRDWSPRWKREKGRKKR